MEFSWGGGRVGFCKSEVNNLKKFMRFNWNFQKGRVVFEKFPSMGKVHMVIFWNYTLGQVSMLNQFLFSSDKNLCFKLYDSWIFIVIFYVIF